jgi:antitoxin VapB
MLPYTFVYGNSLGGAERKTAKIFLNNRSQAVRLPKEFRFDTDEVYIRKEGNDVVLSPRPTDWGAYFEDRVLASTEFMTNVEDLPLQDRALWADGGATTAEESD